MNQLYSINLLLIVGGLTWIERNRFNRIITPFTLSAWPFVIISILTNFVLVSFGFKSVSARVHLFIIVNLILIWLAGFFVTLDRNKMIAEFSAADPQSLFANIGKYHLGIVFISWILIMVNLYKILGIIHTFGGIWILADDKFEKLMSHGIVSHLIELGKVCFLLLIFSFKYSKYKLIVFVTLAGLFINTASIMVKYHLLWLIIISFLFFTVYKPYKIQGKQILVLSGLLFLVMNMFWIFLTIVWGTFSLSNIGVWEFLVKHFLNYFVSGPIVLNYWLDFSSIKPDWSILVVFKNLWNVLIGNPERISAVPLVSHGFFPVAQGISSNVGTSFGVFYLIGGYTFTFASTVVFAFVSYTVYFLSHLKNSKLLIFLNLFLMNLFLLNFFVQYITILSLYELYLLFTAGIGIIKLLDFLRERIVLKSSKV